MKGKSWTTGMILAGALVAASPALTIAGSDEDAQEIETVEIVTHEGGKRYEITVQDGKVEARVNGLRISPDRVVKEDGKIIILDDDGNRIKAFTVYPADSEGALPLSSFIQGGKFAGNFEPPPVMLGVLLDEPGGALQSQLGVSEHAVLIEQVIEGLPADKAGLEQWDIIIEVDGEKLDQEGLLHDILMESEPGDELEVVVIRGGEEEEILIELEAYDPEALGQRDVPFAPVVPGPFTPMVPGAVPFNWRQQFDLEHAREALREAMRSLESRRGDRQGLKQAREKIEQAIRELSEQKDGFGSMLWSFDDSGRLVRPDDDWREAMADEFEGRLEELENEFADRLDELEDRWEQMEDMFERLFERLEEALERRRDNQED